MLGGKTDTHGEVTLRRRIAGEAAQSSARKKTTSEAHLAFAGDAATRDATAVGSACSLRFDSARPGRHLRRRILLSLGAGGETKVGDTPVPQQEAVVSLIPNICGQSIAPSPVFFNQEDLQAKSSVAGACRSLTAEKNASFLLQRYIDIRQNITPSWSENILTLCALVRLSRRPQPEIMGFCSFELIDRVDDFIRG